MHRRFTHTHTQKVNKIFIRKALKRQKSRLRIKIYWGKNKKEEKRQKKNQTTTELTMINNFKLCE